MPELWERQKGESAKAFAAFAIYRDAGDTRGYTAVAQELNKSRTLVSRWGAKWQWQERLDAYLRRRDAEQLKAQHRAIEQMNERHANTAVLFQEKLLNKLREIDLDELKPRDLVKWFEAAVSVERAARAQQGGELMQFEQLGAMAQLQPRIGGLTETARRLDSVDRELLRQAGLKVMRLLILETQELHFMGAETKK